MTRPYQVPHLGILGGMGKQVFLDFRTYRGTVLTTPLNPTTQNTIRSLLRHGWRTAPLLFRCRFLLFEPRLNGRLRNARRFSLSSRFRRRDNHRAKFVEAVVHILCLISESLTGENQFAAIIDPPGVRDKKPSANRVRQSRTAGHDPAQHRLRRDFIDILSAWTRTANE